ncbi:unnamed protein product [Hydatigera taeniaeformis]|uniref:RIC3 domain-containing protein n=1 Tax=Hydatigena taeniaeformis TaxID=6205 RepID=A0A0R3WT10_HYDTA|nr:unnamed protein product [Hydatigera taeniaeformis]
MMTSEAPAPHWIHDCPESRLKWWFPLALTGAIYAVNILYILGKHLHKQLRPEPTPRCTAYPNIFRGIDHNSFDDDDQEFDFMEEEPYVKSKVFWVEESQWGSDDLRTPHTSTTTAVAFASLPEHGMNEDDDEDDETYPGRRVKQPENQINGENTKDNGIALQMNNINSVNAKAVEDAPQRKDGRHRIRQNQCLGEQNGHFFLKLRIFCEQMTSVSYPTGRFMVSQHLKGCIRWFVF